MNGAGKVNVAQSAIHGRGIFAAVAVRRGTTLDVGHVLVVPAGAEERPCALADGYAFDFRGDDRCLAFGVTSLCNHSDRPNAEVAIDEATMTYELYAIVPIDRGEEILIDYGAEYWEPSV